MNSAFTSFTEKYTFCRSSLFRLWSELQEKRVIIQNLRGDYLFGIIQITTFTANHHWYYMVLVNVAVSQYLRKTEKIDGIHIQPLANKILNCVH